MTDIATEPVAAQCVSIEPIKRDDGSNDWTATRQKIDLAYKDFPPDPATGLAPAVQAYNQLWEQETERAILERLTKIDEALGDVPGVKMADWIGEVFGANGVVWDATLAKASPCTRLMLPNGKWLVFAEGVNGALDSSQFDDLCVAGYKDETPSPAVQTRLMALAESAPNCAIAVRGVDSGKQVEGYFSCLSEELRKKGVKP